MDALVETLRKKYGAEYRLGPNATWHQIERAEYEQMRTSAIKELDLPSDTSLFNVHIAALQNKLAFWKSQPRSRNQKWMTEAYKKTLQRCLPANSVPRRRFEASNDG